MLRALRGGTFFVPPLLQISGERVVFREFIRSQMIISGFFTYMNPDGIHTNLDEPLVLVIVIRLHSFYDLFINSSMNKTGTP